MPQLHTSNTNWDRLIESTFLSSSNEFLKYTNIFQVSERSAPWKIYETISHWVLDMYKEVSFLP